MTTYWHVTSARDFRPDAEYKPSSDLGSIFGAGLFVTPNPELWSILWRTDVGGGAQYAAEIDVSRLQGREFQSLGGEDRDQWFIPGEAIEKIKVKRTVPIKQAIREALRSGYGFAMLAFDAIEKSRLCVVDHAQGWGSISALCGGVTDGNPVKWTTIRDAVNGPLSSRIDPDCMAMIKPIARRTGSKENAVEGIQFGIIDTLDPERAVEQVHLLDSDGDGVPDYLDAAPFDPRVSSIPGDLGVRHAAGLTVVGRDGWGEDVMQAIRKDKGFTLRSDIGDGPSSGYMVSTLQSSERRIPVRDLTPEMVADYMSIHQQDLARPDHYLGAWVYKGFVYLDVSRHVRDKGEAMDLARKFSQIAIYDIGNGNEIMTEPEVGLHVAKAGSSVIDFVNSVRATEGLAPLSATRPVTEIQRSAMRVISERDST